MALVIRFLVCAIMILVSSTAPSAQSVILHAIPSLSGSTCFKDRQLSSAQQLIVIAILSRTALVDMVNATDPMTGQERKEVLKELLNSHTISIQAAEKVLQSNQEILTNVVAKLANFGPEACGELLKFIEQVKRDDVELSTHTEGISLQWAKVLLFLHGCRTDNGWSYVDWNRFVSQTLPDARLRGEDLPRASDILILLTTPFRSGVCDNDTPAAGSMLAAYLFLDDSLDRNNNTDDSHELRRRLYMLAQNKSEYAGRLFVYLTHYNSFGTEEKREFFERPWLDQQVSRDSQLAGHLLKAEWLDDWLYRRLQDSTRADAALDVYSNIARDSRVPERLRVRAARVVADALLQGLSGSPEPGKAEEFLQLANTLSPDDYDRYLSALANSANAVKAVRYGIERWRARTSTQEGVAQAGPWRLSAKHQLSIGYQPELIRLATVISRQPEAAQVALLEGDPIFKSIIGELLIEGMGPDGKLPSLAKMFFESASADGDSFATSRLAFMYREGLGVAKDDVKALNLSLSAAEKGETFSTFLTAKAYDDGEGVPADAKIALKYYGRLLAEENLGERSIVSMIIEQVISNSEALNSPEGQTLIMEAAIRNASFAVELGNAYICTECGGVVDVAEAAKWFRVAHDRSKDDDGESKIRAGIMLARVISARPDLANVADEANIRLRKNLASPEGLPAIDGYWNDLESYLMLKVQQLNGESNSPGLIRSMAATLAKICETSISECEEASQIFASGQIDARLVGTGFSRLKSLVTDSKSKDWNSAYHSALIVDLIAFYGDFKGALDFGLAAEKRLNGSRLGFRGFSGARIHTLRRALAERRIRREELPAHLEPLLRYLADRGDGDAKIFLDIFTGDIIQPEQIDTIAQQAISNPSFVDQLRALYETKQSTGGLSQGLVSTAIDLSRALDAKGETKEALRYEIIGLAAQLKLDEYEKFRSGPIVYAMRRICHLSHASERAFNLNAPNVAVMLAKEAVNGLQQLRSQLRDVPQNLQACFADMISDHYRWLAGLLIEQGRSDESQIVIDFLKDFERFQFVEQEPGYEGQTFGTMPFSTEERALQQVLETPEVPAVAILRQFNYFKSLKRSLSAAEAAEYSVVSAQAEKATKLYVSTINGAQEAAEKLSTANPDSIIEGLGRLQSALGTEVTENAVALRYVVLPDRMYVIITTKYGKTTHKWINGEGQYFSEQMLNQEIKEFLAALRDRASDPRPQSRKLYKLLIEPIQDELIGSDLVLLSLDGRLRYVPFGALFDGKRYMAERFAFAALTKQSEISGRRFTKQPMAAFGTTEAKKGFGALPGVEVEVTGLVGDETTKGLIVGKGLLDEDFNRAAFERALVVEEGSATTLRIIHIASHFHLGQKDKDSFLLMGDGTTLSIADIKDDPLNLNFTKVDLMTLSACSTAFAEEAATGKEMETLAGLIYDGGPRTLVATLWSIVDGTSALFMQRFYELREVGGLSRAEALVAVQREFISGSIGSGIKLPHHSIVLNAARRLNLNIQTNGVHADQRLGFAHPAYWAPFILIGNWR